jgi:hypothetical protein
MKNWKTIEDKRTTKQSEIISMALKLIILNTSRKHVNYEEDKDKVSIPMNKPYNIQNTNICNGIFHISVLDPKKYNRLGSSIISKEIYFSFRPYQNTIKCYH